MKNVYIKSSVAAQSWNLLDNCNDGICFEAAQILQANLME
ncbi:hypothetical Protein YC6258_01929 [Gynuella sunshinyii YC6258]|uniref:Uncharacterized protein n=1 Tax=Gynuella sunshinyii YC6258 TaxID=1445510 RepID=A0A0C5VKP4_9GAMM|nr:hypothetical Protein YC6258_01929 [Gynuella sunshinyii YC6258]